MKPKLAWMGGLLAMAMSSATAHAQETQGAFQLGLGTPVFTYGSSTTTLELGGEEQETETSGIGWGIPQDAMFELGYGVTDMIVVGGLLELSGTSQTQEPDDPDADELEASGLALVVLPKIDVMFSPGQKIRPFVGAAGGLLMTSTKLSSGDFTQESSLLGVQLLGRVGLRAFLAPGFSLDPAAFVVWSTASGEIEAETTTFDVKTTNLAAGVLVVASGWIP